MRRSTHLLRLLRDPLRQIFFAFIPCRQTFINQRWELVTILKSACWESVQPFIRNLSNSISIWEKQEKTLGGTINDSARCALACQFGNLRPYDGEPLKDHFGKLLNVQNQLVGTAITSQTHFSKGKSYI
jgi:hypothetical protein